MIFAAAGLLVILMLVPEQVAAHGSLPGGGGFYAGALHPLLAIEHALAVLSLGLVVGSQTSDYSRSPVIALAIGLGSGLAVAMTVDNAEPALLGMSVAFGCALAAALPVPVWVLSVMAGLTGWIVGSDTDLPQPAAPDAFTAFAPYAGVFVGVFLITLNAAAISSSALRPALRIAVRVLGSWIAAIALMVLALRLRVMVEV